MAGLKNALKVVDKRKEQAKVIINGAGAAAIAIAKLLLNDGFRDLILCDRLGALYRGRSDMNTVKERIAGMTNRENRKGILKEVIKGADIFIGVSGPDVLTKDMVESMNERAVIFACANPIPEISPEEATAGGAAVVATGRSDYPNQINNVLAFPGIFRGAFDVRAREINEPMKIADPGRRAVR